MRPRTCIFVNNVQEKKKGLLLELIREITLCPESWYRFIKFNTNFLFFDMFAVD